MATILRLPKVLERTGLGRTTVYDGIKAGTFPRPIKLGVRAVGWVEADIDAWLSARVEAAGVN
ncbi:MAG: AlpA family transcriptional regulator [Fuscovulum sp.]|nr:MAG: AlpA family transcriptional regulator [Fuscovulum sp.]